jgi:hypothetical protein
METVKKYFIYHEYMENHPNEKSVETIDLIVKEDGLYHPYSGMKVEKGWYFDTSGEALRTLETGRN